MLLREKSVAFVHREVDLDQGKPEWFVKLSPLGQVPVLCIGTGAVGFNSNQQLLGRDASGSTDASV
jgi:glutathione S-transferase